MAEPGPSARWTEIGDQVEAAWRQGERLDFEDYLPGSGAERRNALVELVLRELACRLQAGEAVRVEDYLERFPELADEPAQLLKLLIREFELRKLHAAQPTLDEYVERFPEYRTELAAGLRILPEPAALAEAATIVKTAPSAPIDVATGQRVDEPVLGTQQHAFVSLGPERDANELGWVAHYRLLTLLGKGGMGMVFLAEDVHLQRRVALKVLSPEMAKDQGARIRFLREARAMAALNHDHVVTIYQVGEDGDTPYLAMEFLEGESLEDRLRREGKLPINDAIRIARQVADCLVAAHERGLIHRDIKPSNIWLERPDAQVKVLDFGLARASGDETRLTHSGLIVGTPAYMAPEQASGQTVDHQCDLFSLGSVLYEMCTGRRAFTGPDVMSVFMALACDQPPRPRQLNCDVPTELDELIMRLLAKAPAQRPHSARAVVAALSRLAAPTRSAIPPVTPDFDDRGAIWLPGPSVALPAGRPRRANPIPLREREQSRAALPGSIARETYLSQLRLLLEELSCDLCRFGHVTRDGVPPEGVEIRREFPLGIVGAYADLRVAVPGQLPYLVEIKFGYSAERLLQSFRRKYGEGAASSNRSTVTFAASPAGRPGNRLARGDANWLTEIRTERRNDQCL